METSTYDKISVANMLYQQSPKIIQGITERRSQRFFTKGSRSNITAGDTLEFEITTDMFLDGQSSILSFDLSFLGSGVHAISSAADIIDTIEVFYNDTSCQRVSNVNAWVNSLLAYSANKSFFTGAGEMLMGTSNLSNINVPGPVNGARNYCIPLCIFSSFFAQRNFIPLVGNRLRVSITLAKNKDVISYTDNATPLSVGYVLNNVSLLTDIIITSTEYRNKLMMAMSSEKGIRLSYNTLSTGTMSVVGGTMQNLRIPSNYSNALSLFLLYDNQTDKNPTQSHWTLAKHSFPLPSFNTLECYNGSLRFTPSDHLKTPAEVYQSTMKCLSSFADLSGAGTLDYQTYMGTYVPGSTIGVGEYGLFLIGINLERALVSDNNSVINSGVSSTSNGSTNEFIVNLTTKTALDPANSILYCLSHSNALVFKQGGVQVES